jgi:hypothetical protein
MMKVVINPSWNCQLSCAYCWLPHTKINRDAREHDWIEWAEALVDLLPPNSIVDVSGGEPLLYEGLTNLLAYLGGHGLRWAITTNALATEAVEELVRSRPKGAVVVNVSDHQGNFKAHLNIQKLRRAFSVVVHRVEHPAAGHHEGAAGPITYQEWAEGEALDGVRRWCSAGSRHLVIDPGGDAFRCCVEMQLGHKPQGNIFDRSLRLPEFVTFFVCDWGCSTHYRDNPGEWLVEMSAI